MQKKNKSKRQDNKKTKMSIKNWNFDQFRDLIASDRLKGAA